MIGPPAQFSIRYSEEGHPFTMFPIRRGKCSVFSPFSRKLVVGFSSLSFIKLKKFRFIPSLMRDFYHEWVLLFLHLLTYDFL